ncbi:diguanylate cyclase [Hwanghaeella sp.]|uniref:diguanylate cyclase n=1 Tax=Hwanghaeella sp. TaxID=2605943 RepID=UPI003CCBC171
MQDDYSHLVHIESHDELRLYELIPNVVWIFDLDTHGWWWGNRACLDFWGLETLDQLIHKDLSGDTQGARDRTRQTFDLAAKQGLTIDPWTTYPQGKPKSLMMMHRAVTVGPDRHRAIIAYINEEVNLGETPENLLLVEAARYTRVLVTCFTLDGDPVIENPAATEAYKHLPAETGEGGPSPFAARFQDPAAGAACFDLAKRKKGGRWTHKMRTGAGLRDHTLDIRMTRHPLTGDFLLLVAEYDVTDLLAALRSEEQLKEEMRAIAFYDTLTGLPSLHLFQDISASLMNLATRAGEELAVMFIDLDGFKQVNDTYGHDAGDKVLRETARRLEATLRGSDVVSRIGGDEFVLLQTGVKREQDVLILARKLVAALSKPVALEDGESARIGASIGVALYPQHGTDMEALLKAADAAMYRVKKAGKNDFTLVA